MNVEKLGTMRAAIEGDVKNLAKGFDLARKDAKGFGKDFPGWVAPVGVAMVGIGTAIAAGVGFAVKGFGDFGQAMKNVQAVSGATSEEYKKLKKFAIDMGSSTEFSARQAGEGMYFLASAGMAVADQMKTTAAVLSLASATQSELADSSRIVVNTLSGFELEADESRRVADVFARSIATSQANMEKLGASIPIVAATANDFGHSLEGTTAALSLLYDKGLSAQRSSTGLRNALKTLLDVTPEGTKALDDLGLTITDLDPRTQSLESIVRKLEKANFDTAASVKIFGKENDAMTLLVSTGAEELRKFEASLVDAGGAAQDMADIQLDSLNGSLKLLLSSLDGAKLAFGEVFAPAVRSGADLLTDLTSKFNALSDTSKTIVSWSTAVAGGFSLVLGGALLILPKLPLMATGFATLTTSLAAIPMLGPIAIGFTAVAAGIALVAGALKVYKDASKDVFFEEEFGRQQENIKGLEEAIRTHEESLGRLQKAYQTVKDGGIIPFDESLLLAKTGLAGMGSDVEKFIPAIKRMEERLRDTNIELIQAKGGTLEYAIAMVDAKPKAANLATATTDAGTATSGFTKAIEAMFDPFKTIRKLLENYEQGLFGVSQRLRENVSLTKQSNKELAILTDEFFWEKLEARRAFDKKDLEARRTSDQLDNLFASEARDKERSWNMERLEDQKTANIVLTNEERASQDKRAAHNAEFNAGELERQQAADDSIITAQDVKWERIIENQEEAARKRVKIEETTWLDMANFTARGVDSVSSSYYRLRDVFHDVSNATNEFHDTWLSSMADWVSNVAGLLNDLTNAWRSAVTIINKIAGFIPGGGGGAGLAQAAAGLVPGGVGAGEVAGGIGAGAGILGKIGGAGKAAGAGIAKGASAFAGAIAPILPLLGPLALAAGAAYLIDKYHKPPGSMSAKAEAMWLKSIELQKLLAFKENQRYEHALEREKQRAAILAATPTEGFGDTRNPEMVAYAAESGADLFPTRVSFPGTTRQDFLNAARAGQTMQEYMNEKLDQSNVHLEKIAQNTERMVTMEEIRTDRVQPGRVSKEAILDQLADLLAPLLAERGYIS